MGKFTTEQEEFWAGGFGDKYIDRNKERKSIVSNIALFSKVFSLTKRVNSIIEFGANIGNNLKAIKCLLPDAVFSAVEINKKAVAELKKMDWIKAYPISILDFKVDTTSDFVFAKGLLTHINPDYLKKVYDLLYQASNKYIFIAEYYNPTPVEISYRGHRNKLFKRDFAGEMMDRYKDLQLVDYGFVYHRDNNFPQDDATWFLLEKAK